MTLTEAEQFFYEHAGYSYKTGEETPDAGRMRGARELAAAERRLKSGPYYIDVTPDPEPWDGDVPYDGPLWIVELWSVEETAEPKMLGCLGSVACEEGGDYLRVIAAELADEHI